jgi:hypothetical protein
VDDVSLLRLLPHASRSKIASLYHLHRSSCCPSSSCGFGSLVAVLKLCLCALVSVRVRVYVCSAHGSNGSLPLFAWSHIAVVHDVEGKVHIYLNGTKEPEVMQALICTQPCAHTHTHAQ